MTNSVALAAEVADRLDYTTEDLTLWCAEEGHERYADCPDNQDFCKALDVIAFQCVKCSYWKPQRENATPDAGEWQCQECFLEEHAK